MRLQQILGVLRDLAPEHLAESWDHPGLQMGDPAAEVRRAMLCIDLTDAVLREALGRRVQLIVAYHPPIFAPLPALTTLDPRQRMLLTAARRGLAIYSPHTALDSAADGLNDWLAEAVLPGIMAAVSPEARKGALAGGGTIRPIRAAAPRQDQRPYKLVTFVPPDHLDALREALAAAGAGQIGDYADCSFSTLGEGTFRGGETTNPTIGQRGVLERVAERRLEMVFPPGRVGEVVAALMKTHPYEEPAFDLQRLELPPSMGGEGVGQGRVVKLDKPLTLAGLVQRLKRHLKARTLEVAAPAAARPIRTIGFCAGAGGSLLADAGPVDAYVTGEMRHHDVLAAQTRGTAILLAGHTQTERPYLPVYRRRIVRRLGAAVQWEISRADKPPGRIW